MWGSDNVSSPAFENAWSPLAVSDLDGRVLKLNQAMRTYLAGRLTVSDAPPEGVAALLSDAPEPESLVYRMLIAVEAGRPREEGVESDSLFAVTARPTSHAEVLWRLTLRDRGSSPRPVGRDPVFERAPVALAVLDRGGRIRRANAEARRVMGPLAAPGVDLSARLTGLGRPMKERIGLALSPYGAKGANAGWELTEAEVDGRQRFFRVELAPYDAPTDIDAALIAAVTDATRLKTQEEQFVQSQKIQAVGQLAGGVAHDFNNLLTVINGHAEMLLNAREIVDPDYSALAEIHQTGLRASNLVRQLLAFSRRQMLRPRPVDLSESVTDLSTMLQRLVGEKVRLRLEAGDKLWPVNADPGQIEQTVVNLVVNARDAMPEGGEALIRTTNRRIAAPLQRDGATVAPGDYVEIEVSDEGVGITEDAREHIFEPFFTTKPVGEGTGLGLSTVYGVVKQTGGFIFCDSEPGAGASFRILLPRFSGPLESSESKTHEQVDLTGDAAVLIVEDEEAVRMLAARALRQRGYQVTEAESSPDALELIRDPSQRIDVIVSDVVMPEMDGPTLVHAARQTRPKVGVVFMSGYSEDMFRGEGAIGSDDAFIAKPFVLRDFVAAVKRAVTACDGMDEESAAISIKANDYSGMCSGLVLDKT